MQLTEKELKHLGETNRVKLVTEPGEVRKLVHEYVYDPECPPDECCHPGCAAELNAAQIAIVEFRDSGFQSCAHDWDEIRFYDADRTLREVFVIQRKDPRNIIS